MSQRVGPPTPRNEPWKPPVPPLGEQPGRTAVASERCSDGTQVCTQGMTDFERHTALGIPWRCCNGHALPSNVSWCTECEGRPSRVPIPDACTCITLEAREACYKSCSNSRVPIPDPVLLAARDQECLAWIGRNYEGIASPREVMMIKTAFCAGWSGGVNRVKNNSSEPIDLRCAACKSDD